MSESDTERTAPDGVSAEPAEQPVAEAAPAQPTEDTAAGIVAAPATEAPGETATETAASAEPTVVAESTASEEDTPAAVPDSAESATPAVEESTATADATSSGDAFASPKELITVRAGTGAAFTVREGGRFQIVDEAGKQVCVLVAFRQADRSEWASVSHTREGNGSLVLTLNGTVMSNRRGWMMRLEEDTVGRHDLTMPACDGKRYLFHYGLTDHPNCRDNLMTALAEYDIPNNFLPDPINLFMHLAVLRRGELEMREPLSEPGDYVVLRALTDLIVAVSACPQDQDATNARTPTDLTVRIFDS